MNINGASDSQTKAPIHGVDTAPIPDEWLAALSRGIALEPHGTSSTDANLVERKALGILASRLTSILRI